MYSAAATVVAVAASDALHVEESIMLVITTPTVEGYPIKRYIGIVSGETISGSQRVQGHRGRISGHIVGGRSTSYEQEIQNAYNTAVSEMAQRAESMGANAVVGVNVDYFTAGADNGMVAAIATRTAVII